MVLYHANGRVVIAHENYLEQEARKEALAKGYIEQIDFCRHKATTVASTLPVRIIIDTQYFRTLYSWCHDGNGSDWEDIRGFEQTADHEITTDIDRDTLRMCSTFADEYFTNNPEENQLHLPVRYSWQHVSGQSAMDSATFENVYLGRVAVTDKRHVYHTDDQTAFIRSIEIELYILPWLLKVQAYVAEQKRKLDKRKAPAVSASEKLKWTLESDSPAARDGPLAIEIPEDLLHKIHLYNAMLQLGLPKFVQLPLIDAIVLEIYNRKLSQCELDTLEITVGRFYSRGVAVLDPVLNHLVGTYAFRTPDDRCHPQSAEDADRPGKEALEKASTAKSGEPDKRAHMKRADGTYEKKHKDDVEPGEVNFTNTKRRYLEYTNQEVDRGVHTGDTYLLPPELPVIAHSIKNWSGVRRNGSTAAAHTGFPLNVGRYKKFTRRDGANAINVEEYVEYETNRLARRSGYRRRPGVRDITVVPEDDNNHPNPAGDGA